MLRGRRSRAPRERSSQGRGCSTPASCPKRSSALPAQRGRAVRGLGVVQRQRCRRAVFGARVTRRPSAVASSRSSAGGVGIARPRLGGHGWAARRRTRLSVARTLSPRRTTSTASAAGSGAASSARAWPADSAPSSRLLAHRRGQRQQPYRVGDVAAALADRFGEARLAAAEFARQAAIGFGLLERRQILALQVLDQRDLERLGIAERAARRPAPRAAPALRRPPAPLAGDQLEIRRRRRRPAAPGAAGPCPSRGSIARARRVRPRRNDGAAGTAPGRIASIGTICAPSVRAAGSAAARAPASPSSAARPRPSGCRFAPAVAHARPRTAARAAASRRRAGYRPATRRSVVVDQHRLAVRRRLRDAHVARDHRLVNLVAEMAAHIAGDLLAEIVAAVVHRQQHALERRAAG